MRWKGDKVMELDPLTKMMVAAKQQLLLYKATHEPKPQCELVRTNSVAASCCNGCVYEVRCERDTSWRGRCPDYAEYMTDY